MIRDLFDEDGENRAVRSFLSLYGGMKTPTVHQMRAHLSASGFDGCWPQWTDEEDGHLTKGGAQDWLRHLFALESAWNRRSTDNGEAALQELADQAQELDMGYQTISTANTMAGFNGCYYEEHRRHPTEQEIWNAGVASGKRRAAIQKGAE